MPIGSPNSQQYGPYFPADSARLFVSILYALRSFQAAELAEAAHLRFGHGTVLLHHAAHVAVLPEDFVDLLHAGAAPAGDALAALAVDQIVIGALGGGHRIDDGLD